MRLCAQSCMADAIIQLNPSLVACGATACPDVCCAWRGLYLTVPYLYRQLYSIPYCSLYEPYGMCAVIDRGCSKVLVSCMCEQKELKETRSAHTTRHYSLYTIQYTRLVSIHPIRSCIPDRRWSTNRIPPEICTSQGGRSQSMVCIRKSVVAQPSYGRIARQCACAIGRRVGAARPPSPTLLLCVGADMRAHRQFGVGILSCRCAL